MRLEKLNLSNSKGKIKIAFASGCLITILLIVLVNIIASKALYRKTESVQLASGTVNYVPYDFKIMAMYQEKKSYSSDNDKYEEIKIMPGSEYVINESKSYCTLDNKVHDNKAVLKTFEGRHIISHLTKQDKCYLYFDRETSEASKTLFNLGLKTEGAIDSITGPSCSDNSQCGNSKNMNQNGLYYAGEDDDGPSYIFRGTVDNNWVKFGQTSDSKDIWWRILRINGNGSIRLIYAGEGDDFGTTGNGKNALDNIAYNTNYNDNTYVGYYIGATKQSTYEATHTNATPSTIASETEKWFKDSTNLDETAQLKHIDENTGFCNNRQISSAKGEWWTDEGDGVRGTSLVATVYKGFYNIDTDTTNLSPRKDVNYANLKCSSNVGYEKNKDYNRDYFTWKSHATRGNQKLENPVGQITVDEAILAGGFSYTTNKKFWLYTDEKYWTMSAHSSILSVNGSGSRAIFISNSGWVQDHYVTILAGARPVINLKADTSFEPSNGQTEWGTKTNPYVVKIN